MTEAHNDETLEPTVRVNSWKFLGGVAGLTVLGCLALLVYWVSLPHITTACEREYNDKPRVRLEAWSETDTNDLFRIFISDNGENWSQVYRTLTLEGQAQATCDTVVFVSDNVFTLPMHTDAHYDFIYANDAQFLGDYDTIALPNNQTCTVENVQLQTLMRELTLTCTDAAGAATSQLFNSADGGRAWYALDN